MSNIKIVCVDRSEHGYDALKYYLEHVHRPDSQLLVCHCPEYWKNIGPMEGPSPAMVKDLIEEAKQNTEKIKEEVNKILNGVPGEFVVLEGKDAWKTITDLAHNRHADLIVVGCRGLGKIRRTLLGSTSDSILHHAHCAVLICKH